MTKGRSKKKRGGIYKRALLAGIDMGLAAAEREARMCALSWDGVSRIAAQTVAEQIAKLEISDEEVDRKLANRVSEINNVYIPLMDAKRKARLSADGDKAQSEGSGSENGEGGSEEVEDT